MHSLSKRGSYSGRATYYAVGTGACGGTYSDSDFVVALNEDQYGDLGSVSSYCFGESLPRLHPISDQNASTD